MISKEQLKLDLVGGISIGNSGKMESRESHIIYLGHRSLSYYWGIDPFLISRHSLLIS
jgi:hypothetical protein